MPRTSYVERSVGTVSPTGERWEFIDGMTPPVPPKINVEVGTLADKNMNCEYRISRSIIVKTDGVETMSAISTLIEKALPAEATYYIARYSGNNLVSFRCEFCGKWANWGNRGRAISKKLYCPDCARVLKQCSICNETLLAENGLISPNSSFICKLCAPSYRVCPHCGSWTDIMEGDYCLNCMPKKIRIGTDVLDRAEYNELDYIHDYTHKPLPVFHKTDAQSAVTGGLRFFGVENEVDTFPTVKHIIDASVKLVEISNGEDLFYLKRDGSIHAGFEVVTHPATLDFHRTKMPWEGIRKIVVANKGRSHETLSCGLHVHFNVAALGKAGSARDLSTMKLLHLVEKFWRQIIRFSRRHPDELRKWACRYYDDFIPTAENLGKLNDVKMMRARHMSVNLCNARTVEMRVFKGTLNPQTVLATLEFVDCLITAATSISVEDIQKLTWKDFIGGAPADYTELKEYVERRKLCA